MDHGQSPLGSQCQAGHRVRNPALDRHRVDAGSHRVMQLHERRMGSPAVTLRVEEQAALLQRAHRGEAACGQPGDSVVARSEDRRAAAAFGDAERRSVKREHHGNPRLPVLQAGDHRSADRRFPTERRGRAVQRVDEPGRGQGMEVGHGRPLLGDDRHLLDCLERPAEVTVEAEVERCHIIADRFLLDRRTVRHRGGAFFRLQVTSPLALVQCPVCRLDHGSGHGHRGR